MPRVVPSQVRDAIDRFWPWADGHDGRLNEAIGGGEDNVNKLRTITRLFEAIPAQLLLLDGDAYVRLVSALGAVDLFASAWETRLPNQAPIALRPIPEYGAVSPVVLIRQALAGCPDHFPASTSSELSFIGDRSVRSGLLTDLSAIEIAMTNAEWKGATVLGGALSEALLLCALNEKRSRLEIDQAVIELVKRGVINQPNPDIQAWTLAQYIHVSQELRIIKEDTATQARLVKDFRNLIHPGRALATGLRCDAGTAHAAVAAIQFVIRDIQ